MGRMSVHKQLTHVATLGGTDEIDQRFIDRLREACWRYRYALRSEHDDELALLGKLLRRKAYCDAVCLAVYDAAEILGERQAWEFRGKLVQWAERYEKASSRLAERALRVFGKLNHWHMWRA